MTLPGKARQVVLNQVGYYPFGPISGWVFGNGRAVKRAYDKNYRPKQFEDLSPGGLALGFAFDSRGDLTGITPLTGQTAAIGVDYDALGRMTNMVEQSNQALIHRYAYDAVGNRLQAEHNGVTQQCRYPSNSNRLLSAAGLLRSYDDGGNTTAIGGSQRTFSYDAQGRMTEARRNGQLVMRYRYNGKGEQVERIVGKTSVYSIFDEQGHWLGDVDDAGKPKQQAIWLGDIPVAVVGSNSPVGEAASSEQTLA